MNNNFVPNLEACLQNWSTVFATHACNINYEFVLLYYTLVKVLVFSTTHLPLT